MDDNRSKIGGITVDKAAFGVAIKIGSQTIIMSNDETRRLAECLVRLLPEPVEPEPARRSRRR